MEKEREPKFESGFSEKELDKAMNKVADNDQVKAGNIFDPKKKNPPSRKASKGQEKNSGVILDSTSQ